MNSTLVVQNKITFDMFGMFSLFLPQNSQLSRGTISKLFERRVRAKKVMYHTIPCIFPITSCASVFLQPLITLTCRQLGIIFFRSLRFEWTFLKSNDSLVLAPCRAQQQQHWLIKFPNFLLPSICHQIFKSLPFIR